MQTQAVESEFHIDLNPLRAGLVNRPEDYRWNSLGYHVQTGNKDNFLSLDFGLKEFGVMNAEERLRGYRRYVYEAGAVDCSEFGQRKVIGKMVVEKERKKEFKIKKSTAFDTGHAILRIPESSARKNLLPPITIVLSISLCRKEKRFPRRLPVWMGSIR